MYTVTKKKVKIEYERDTVCGITKKKVGAGVVTLVCMKLSALLVQPHLLSALHLIFISLSFYCRCDFKVFVKCVNILYTPAQPQV